MEPAEVEFTSLVGWLRTFPLQAETSSANDLSSGLAMAEALVQIEPSVFTPSWYAGLLQSNQTNHETLSRILNLLLHYYRHNLGEVGVGELPVPDLPPGCQDLSPDTVATFLKLLLGVAVTCSNKQTFIAKIMSLDETTQHALTACIASFVYTKEWSGGGSSPPPAPLPRPAHLNHVVNDLNNKSAPSPSGDEVWAQKCHELDFQVAMLKEERSNLMTENEELYSKVKTAQTLSRKDSIKAREFERELAHIKDEFERLRLAYEGTRGQLEAMEVRLRSPTTSSDDLARIKEESSSIRKELNKMKVVVATMEVGEKGEMDLAEVFRRVQEQDLVLADVKATLEYQAGLGQEVECLKDQVDLLRESSHKTARCELELADIRQRLQEFQVENSDMVEIIRQNQNRTLMSLESETCLSSARNSIERLDHTVDYSFGRLEHTVDHSIGGEMVNFEMECEAVKDNDTSEINMTVVSNGIDIEDPSMNLSTYSLNGNRSLGETLVMPAVKQMEEESEEVSVKVFLNEHIAEIKKEEMRMVQTGSPDATLASRPESELILCDDGVGRDEEEEEEILATPRQLEQLLEEAGSDASVEEEEEEVQKQVAVSHGEEPTMLEEKSLFRRPEEHIANVIVQQNRIIQQDEKEDEVLDGSQQLLRIIKDPTLDLSLESIEATFDDEKLIPPHTDITRTSPEFLEAANLIEKNPDRLFDPDDPSVTALEEWEVSSPEKSALLDEGHTSTKSLRDMLKFKKMSKNEERNLLSEKFGEDETDSEDKVNVNCNCVNSWLLKIFVKIFD